MNGRLENVPACKTPVEGDMEVTVPSHAAHGCQAVEDFYSDRTNLLEFDPAVTKKYEQGSTSVYFLDRLLLVEEGDTTEHAFAVSVDLGTTTLAAVLVDLKTGLALGSSSTLNPLVRYGHDVLSRISYCNVHTDGLQKLHAELISAVNLLTGVLTSRHAIDSTHIYQLTAAGNTTMQHIFLNKQIQSIGEYPYRAEILDAYTTSAEELAIHINEHAPVTTFPCMSAFVGGDIVAGLTAVSLKDSDKPALFIDVGTNGEIVLLTGEKMIATSCAAGPCFEGMTISIGMRAGEGAIEGVTLKDGGSFTVIGGGKARGICGSGLLELTSELIRTGIVNRAGRLQPKDSAGFPSELRDRLIEEDGKRFFSLTDAVSVSQEDIRQVQLARAAIRAGVDLLLSESGFRAEELKTILVAGGFGYHLNPEAIFRVGLIPSAPHAQLMFIGNSSLEGARRMLVARENTARAAEIAGSAHIIELSGLKDFETKFVREMRFG
jgi:uncharacterized 2Fe-2S/4Fe-4S cluster protein (DUF4445 family)